MDGSRVRPFNDRRPAIVVTAVAVRLGLEDQSAVLQLRTARAAGEGAGMVDVQAPAKRRPGLRSVRVTFVPPSPGGDPGLGASRQGR